MWRRLQRTVTIAQIFTEDPAIMSLVSQGVVLVITKNSYSSEMVAVESCSAADGQVKVASSDSVLQVFITASFMLTLLKVGSATCKAEISPCK